MSNRAARNGKALSLLIVWSLALVGIFAAIVALSPATRAGTCDQIGINITGDWTIRFAAGYSIPLTARSTSTPAEASP